MDKNMQYLSDNHRKTKAKLIANKMKEVSGNKLSKIASPRFNPNGYDGQYFYSLFVEMREKPGFKLLVTFTMWEKDLIEISNCRVIDPLDLDTHYKGDEIGRDLQMLLNTGELNLAASMFIDMRGR